MQISIDELKELIAPTKWVLDVIETHDERMQALTMAVRNLTDRILDERATNDDWREQAHITQSAGMQTLHTDLGNMLNKIAKLNNRLADLEAAMVKLTKGKKR